MQQAVNAMYYYIISLLFFCTRYTSWIQEFVTMYLTNVDCENARGYSEIQHLSEEQIMLLRFRIENFDNTKDDDKGTQRSCL